MPITHALHPRSPLSLGAASRRAPEPPPLSASARTPTPAAFGSAEVHGLRNPLAGVRATVQLAQIQSDENPALADLLGEALAEVDRLDGRIRALLTIHQTHENRPRQIHLGRVLETVTRALELRCKSQGITLNWQMDAELSALEADPDLIEDALLELGQNALRASTAPGRISLEARMHPNALELRVRDTGAGIPQAIQERIFDPFFTTHSDGTGVGLPSIRRRIEQAGGTLELDSSSTRGSSFLVRLPIARN